MADHLDWGGTIRKLWPSETDKFRDHLLRLDANARRLRFAHAVNDTFIANYAKRMLENCSIVFGYVENGEVRAAAELRKLSEDWDEDAEAAFSVKRPCEDRGIGTELMGHIIRSARNRGIKRLHMSCLAENRKMQAIALKHEAQLRFDAGDVIGEILPDGSDYFSFLEEAVDDRFGYILAVLDLSVRARQTAKVAQPVTADRMVE